MTLLAFLVSFGAVVLAEMGDKTQLLAMAFATRYRFIHVILGVFFATVVNHAMAVAAGNYITRFHSFEGWIQGFAAFSFIIFGLWTLQGDTLDGQEKKPSRFGPVLTVAFAFFMAEMGDKTQFTTLALAARFPAHPAGILMGTTLGMLVADAFGIGFGVLLCKRIPEETIKVFSAAIFMIFGFYGVYQVAQDMFKLSLTATIAVLAVLAIASGITILFIRTASKKKRQAVMVVKECIERPPTVSL
jgi:Ca2+/H+ antiporter, TMEM165/GDT1 family